MAPTSGRIEHLFIVRVWQEPSQAAPVHWRGSIEHIPSAQRVYFESLDDLFDFISLRVNTLSNSFKGNSDE
ncbi:MAG: hypothetical protein HY868_17725 [Chloroflexi bacterium]|nr:hypothetical protein [Chloroflexota bacterium]